MEKLTDHHIQEKISQSKIVEFESQFSLENLVGKTIAEHRKVENLEEYCSEYENKPEDYNVLIFSDNTFLAISCWGDGECGHLRYFFYDGKKTLYSDQLLGLF